MKAALCALVVTGCGFSSSTGGGDDTSTLCPLPLTPEYTDPCTAAPSNVDRLPDVTIGDAAQIDTNNGQITGPGVPVSPPSTVEAGVRIVWTKNFTIAPAGKLRVYGPLPLMIVATNEMRIAGLVDASSNMFAAGPGANPPACNAELAAQPGATCAQHGGSGGGGGGFGAVGGAGGEGGDTHDCGDGNDGKPGGAGGMALGMRPSELRGGCPGANGAPTNAVATSTGGSGGSGGGAIALVARVKITVSATGKVNAGGGGGRPGNDRAGGGGGGSGGMIFLESPDIDLQAGSVLAANGGGGAAGTDNGIAMPGEDALASADDANGGMPDPNGGTGGNGGVIMFEAGGVGGLATRGGGGGGGGVGVIRLHEMTSMRAGLTTPAIAN